LIQSRDLSAFDPPSAPGVENEPASIPVPQSLKAIIAPNQPRARRCVRRLPYRNRSSRNEFPLDGLLATHRQLANQSGGPLTEGEFGPAPFDPGGAGRADATGGGGGAPDVR